MCMFVCLDFKDSSDSKSRSCLQDSISQGLLMPVKLKLPSKFFIYIYAFSRHFYPKQLTVHSGYTFIVSMCVPWELNPQPFALLMQCSTAEPQEHI